MMIGKRIVSNFFSPVFLKNLDFHLLVSYPIVWATKIHWVFYHCLIFFSAVSFLVLIFLQPSQLKIFIRYGISCLEILSISYLFAWFSSQVRFNDEIKFGDLRLKDRVFEAIIQLICILIILFTPLSTSLLATYKSYHSLGFSSSTNCHSSVTEVLFVPDEKINNLRAGIFPEGPDIFETARGSQSLEFEIKNTDRDWQLDAYLDGDYICEDLISLFNFPTWERSKRLGYEIYFLFFCLSLLYSFISLVSQRNGINSISQFLIFVVHIYVFSPFLLLALAINVKDESFKLGGLVFQDSFQAGRIISLVILGIQVSLILNSYVQILRSQVLPEGLSLLIVSMSTYFLISVILIFSYFSWNSLWLVMLTSIFLLIIFIFLLPFYIIFLLYTSTLPARK